MSVDIRVGDEVEIRGKITRQEGGHWRFAPHDTEATLGFRSMAVVDADIASVTKKCFVPGDTIKFHTVLFEVKAIKDGWVWLFPAQGQVGAVPITLHENNPGINRVYTK